MNSPTLWIIATPIGNMEDLSPRAIRVLASVDLVLAEDTRKAQFLLARHGINAKKILSFFEHNEFDRQANVLTLLKSGKNIALITDAGTPLLSDPGYRLVRACRKENINVSPIPGPSAPIAALSASGLPPIPFSFLGFLPKSRAAKTHILEQFISVPGSLIFFERKNRLYDSLEIAYKILGNREFMICRELTKEHEEFIYGELGGLAFVPQNLLGEITVIIGPANNNEQTPKDEIILLIDSAIDEGLKPRVAAKLISEKCNGWTADEIYKMMEEIKKQAEI